MYSADIGEETFDNDDACPETLYNAIAFWNECVDNGDHASLQNAFEQVHFNYGTSASTPLYLEKMCRNCWGSGHDERNCPSTKREDRTHR